MGAFAEMLKLLRVKRGITQEQLASMLEVSRSTIGMYETGSREPDFETSEAIADIFNVDMDYLMGRSQVERKTAISSIPPGFMPPPPTVKRPLVGRIACGQPILAEENIEDYLDVPAEKHIDFCLECVGDSMIEAGIQDGDIAYIRKQPTVENGQIAAVRIGDEATLKRVYRTPETLTLMPANGSYAPLVFTREEINTVCIEGKMVGFTHWL